jgi:hypothetical protein
VASGQSNTFSGFSWRWGKALDTPSDLKVSSLYNIGKLQFKVDKNPTWRGSWMLLDALFPVEKGPLARP